MKARAVWARRENGPGGPALPVFLTLLLEEVSGGFRVWGPTHHFVRAPRRPLAGLCRSNKLTPVVTHPGLLFLGSRSPVQKRWTVSLFAWPQARP